MGKDSVLCYCVCVCASGAMVEGSPRYTPSALHGLAWADLPSTSSDRLFCIAMESEKARLFSGKQGLRKYCGLHEVKENDVFKMYSLLGYLSLFFYIKATM